MQVTPRSSEIGSHEELYLAFLTFIYHDISAAITGKVQSNVFFIAVFAKPLKPFIGCSPTNHSSVTNCSHGAAS